MFYKLLMSYHLGMLTLITPLPVFETVTVGVKVRVMLTFGLASPSTLLVDPI